MQKVKRIGVLSLAKISGIFFAIFGLIVTVFAPIGMKEPYFGTATIIVFPILYGIVGFVGGLITAFFYNLVAGKIGGLEVEIAK